MSFRFWVFSITHGAKSSSISMFTFFAHLMLVTCLRPKQNVVMSRRTHHKHETAPLSLYNRHTITLSLSLHVCAGGTCFSFCSALHLTRSSPPPPPLLREHRLVYAPGPGLTVTLPNFLTTAFTVRKLHPWGPPCHGTMVRSGLHCHCTRGRRSNMMSQS